MGYALAGNHSKVEEYRITHEASPNAIAVGYAQASNDAKVEEYHLQHDADVSSIAMGYALANNHVRVEEYRLLYRADPGLIAIGYARTGNHGKVDEYRLRHLVNPDFIAMGYALAGNHSRVEYYRKHYNASLKTIAQGYARSSEPVPRLYFAVNILVRHGPAGHAIIDVMHRLRTGQDRRWNPFWMNSGTKLDHIIYAVEGLKFTDRIEELINNPKSELYIALNTHRAAIVNLFRWLGFSHARSLIYVKDQLFKMKQKIKNISRYALDIKPYKGDYFTFL